MSDHFDPFWRMDELPIHPPFLVRDVDPRRVVERHRERMAGQGITIQVPKQERPLNGMAVVGLAFDQQEALLDALAGDYTARHWSDGLPELRATYPALERAFDAFEGDDSVAAADVRRVVPEVLAQVPTDSNLRQPMDFLYRAWQLRRQVVIERRPMSLIPVITGDTQGDTPSFTPVLKRMEGTVWRMGWPGDPVPVSPREIRGENVREVMADVWATYSAWYNRDQDWWHNQMRAKAEELPDHLFIPVWAQRLRETHRLSFGAQDDVVVDNVSHNQLFRVTRPGGVQVLVRTSPLSVVRLAIVAGNGGGLIYPSPPTMAEVQAAYLAQIAKRGEQADMVTGEATPELLAPLRGEGVQPAEAYMVRVSGGAGQVCITTAWLSGHGAAHAVVSGDEVRYPARAVLASDRSGSRLGLVPFCFKTRKPDMKDRWASTSQSELNLSQEDTRRALSAWTAWVWRDRAGLKKYQPEG